MPLAGLNGEMKASGDRNWYVGGHFSIGHLDRIVGLAPDDFLFSVVRDPVERIASLHRLLARSPEWLPQVNLAIGKSMDYFYDCCIDKGVLEKNTQCSYISGADNYESASASLSRYDCLGSMSDFSGFLNLLGHEVFKKTGVAFKYLDTHHNAAAPTGVEISSALRSRIEKDFAEDFMLVAEVERRQAAMLQDLQR
ncbi:hypothetical protein ABS772_18340 [Methylorubrum podarium]|uniref:Sulfotransferase family protein n=1 Tax=Methylorubrum podarium TaxID=200476 RepID=A0ABV1QR29_9HYPH